MPKKEIESLEAVIEALSAEHAEVDDMFQQYKKLMDLEAPGAERKRCAMQICDALTAHADFEEKYFYPAARKHLDKDAQDCVDHADVEHESIKNLIAKITAAKSNDAHLDAYVHVLQEYVAHHVEEEENDLFCELRKAEAPLANVAKQLPARHQEDGVSAVDD